MSDVKSVYTQAERDAAPSNYEFKSIQRVGELEPRWLLVRIGPVNPYLPPLCICSYCRTTQYAGGQCTNCGAPT